MTRRILWLLSALLLSACAARVPSATLWHLAPVSGMPPAWQADAPSIYLAPVQVPRYVDRPQLVQRSGPSQLDTEDFHRWAEPLDTAVTRLLAEELARRLASEQVVAYPQEPGLAIDYRVLVEVVRLDGRVGESVDLVARWSVRAGDTGAVVATARADFKVAAGNDMESFVTAHAQALAQLAAEIAVALEAMAED
jgi:uncharacterized lipoprotein YmbA